MLALRGRCCRATSARACSLSRTLRAVGRPVVQTCLAGHQWPLSSGCGQSTPLWSREVDRGGSTGRGEFRYGPTCHAASQRVVPYGRLILIEAICPLMGSEILLGGGRHAPSKQASHCLSSSSRSGRKSRRIGLAESCSHRHNGEEGQQLAVEVAICAWGGLSS